MLKNFKLLTVTILAVLALGLSACETLSGAGRDLQKAGNALEDAAN
ncbi:MAG: entericidin A/B family lipoprotein [Pseudomonadota bacterium]